MNDNIAVPKWFWVVGVVLLLWGAMGIFSFYAQITMSHDEVVARIGEAAADRTTSLPHWTWWVFGVAVWSGMFGSIALLLRRAWAQPLYLISLAAVIVQFGYYFCVARMHEIMGWSAAAFPAFIILMAAIELWFATTAKRKGWIG